MNIDKSPTNFSNQYLVFRNFQIDKTYDVNLEDTAIFTGHAKLPNGIALYEYLKVVSCALLVDMRSTKVLDATFTTLSPLTGSYISSLIIGWSFRDGMEVLEDKFDKQVYITSKKAFLKTVEVALQKYNDLNLHHPSIPKT